MTDYTLLILVSLLTVFIFMVNGQVWAISVSPSEDLLKSKLTDTLKSVTANVSSSIQNDIDKAISSTMDILIDSSMRQLNNSTILGNSDSPSTVRFNEGARPFSLFDISP